MANNFKEVSPNQDKIWNFEEDGKDFVGYLIKIETNKGSRKNSNLYSFKSKEDESTVKIWGTKVLDDRLGEISLGVLVKIEWLGKKTTQDGSGSYHVFKVFQDPNDTVEISSEVEDSL
jgi:hypothetical protein